MYDWVSEGSIRKYNRAVASLQKDKKEVTEEAVKALYQQYGGLVLGEATSVQGAEPGDEPALVERAAEADAPKRKRKNS